MEFSGHFPVLKWTHILWTLITREQFCGVRSNWLGHLHSHMHHQPELWPNSLFTNYSHCLIHLSNNDSTASFINHPLHQCPPCREPDVVVMLLLGDEKRCESMLNCLETHNWLQAVWIILSILVSFSNRGRSVQSCRIAHSGQHDYSLRGLCGVWWTVARQSMWFLWKNMIMLKIVYMDVSYWGDCLNRVNIRISVCI